jgi:hypothetical protein
MKHVRECADITNAFVRQSLNIGKKPAGFSTCRRHGFSYLFNYGCEGNEILAGRVVQFARDSSAPFILGPQNTSSKLPHPRFRTFTLGDIHDCANLFDDFT